MNEKTKNELVDMARDFLILVGLYPGSGKRVELSHADFIAELNEYRQYEIQMAFLVIEQHRIIERFNQGFRDQKELRKDANDPSPAPAAAT